MSEEKIVYVFHLGGFNRNVPEERDGSILHAVPGAVSAVQVRFAKDVAKAHAQVLNYGNTRRIGHDAFVRFEDAKQRALKLLDVEKNYLEGRLDVINAAMRKLEGEHEPPQD